MNSKPEEIIMTTEDRKLYYVSGLRVSSALDDPRTESKIVELTRGPRNPDLIIEMLKSTGIRYLLEVKFMGESSSLFTMLRPWVESHPSNIAFSSAGALIIDLTRR